MQFGCLEHLTPRQRAYMALGFIRRLSRVGDDGMSAANIVRRYQTIERVVNGTFSMQKEWMLSRGMPWNEQEVGAPSPPCSVARLPCENISIGPKKDASSSRSLGQFSTILVRTLQICSGMKNTSKISC